MATSKARPAPDPDYDGSDRARVSASQVKAVVLEIVLEGYLAGEISFDRACTIARHAAGHLSQAGRWRLLGKFVDSALAGGIVASKGRGKPACLKRLAVEVVDLANKRDGLPLMPSRRFATSAYEDAAEHLRRFGIEFTARQIKRWHQREQ